MNALQPRDHVRSGDIDAAAGHVAFGAGAAVDDAEAGTQ